MNKKGIFLVSLNSKKLDHFLDNEYPLTIDNNLTELDLLVFDNFETLNGIFFNDRNVNNQNNLLEDIIERVKTQIVATNKEKRNFIRFTEKNRELNQYILAVYKEYYSNASFKRHCKSQIFQNLQPKLRDLNITNHKSNLIELIAPFLIAEIALYLYIFSMEYYQIIFGFENEMGIIADIKNGKYPSFNIFIKQKTDYQKVEF